MSARRASFLGVTTCAARAGFVVVVLFGMACEDSAAPPVDGAAGADAVADAGADTAAPVGNASLSGTVKDRAGVVVASARIETGAGAADSDAQGKFTLVGLAPGPVLVKVTRNWFKPFEATVTAAAGAVTPFDITLDEIPLKIEAADRALADGYNAGFDWTKQTLSIVIVPRPSRQDFDNAVYFHNPALYRDTTQRARADPGAAAADRGRGRHRSHLPGQRWRANGERSAGAGHRRRRDQGHAAGHRAGQFHDVGAADQLALGR